jgi:2-dehydro-3-deoxyglucarate aldolase/4-hydroxy-2-oxoheptanedioate aldolase
MTTDSTTFRQRVLRGDLLLGAFLNLGSPAAAELCARAGFDWLIVDLEHGVGNEADLVPVLTAIETTRTAALVRPASGERLRIGRALDLGAAGIMVPRLETVAEVREAVSYLRYPPDGVRGVALLTRGARFGTVAHAQVRSLNEEVLGIFQVESPLAVANAGEIAAIDGVDVLFVGPSDLSHSLGIPGQLDHPDYLAALDTVVAASHGAGKSAGILLRQARDLERHVELGFRFVGIGSDGGFVVDAAAAALAAPR